MGQSHGVNSPAFQNILVSVEWPDRDNDKIQQAILFTRSTLGSLLLNIILQYVWSTVQTPQIAVWNYMDKGV